MRIGQDGPTAGQLEDFLGLCAQLPNIEGQRAQDAILASDGREQTLASIGRLVAHGEYLGLQSDWLDDARELLLRA